MNKEVYEVPSVEVVSFEVEGVIALSFTLDESSAPEIIED